MFLLFSCTMGLLTCPCVHMSAKIHTYANSKPIKNQSRNLSKIYMFIVNINIPQRSKMLEALDFRWLEALDFRWLEALDFRWLGFEEQLFTCTRSMAIMGLIHCIHLGVAMLLCFGTCKDSHSPPKGALILPEWQNS